MSRVQRFNFEFIIFVAIKIATFFWFNVFQVKSVPLFSVDCQRCRRCRRCRRFRRRRRRCRRWQKKSTPSSSTVHGSETFFFFFSVTTTRFKSKLARLSVIEADKSMSANKPSRRRAPTSTTSRPKSWKIVDHEIQLLKDLFIFDMMIIYFKNNQ